MVRAGLNNGGRVAGGGRERGEERHGGEGRVAGGSRERGEERHGGEGRVAGGSRERGGDRDAGMNLRHRDRPRPRRHAARRLIVAAAGLASVWLALAAPAPEASAQPPPPVPTATPPPGPPIDLSGRWSVTRTYFRSCPRCGGAVIRTAPWRITQVAGDVRVDRGPRGAVVGSGPAYLTLEGTETEGFSVQRFWYATLHVAVDGSRFEGAFNGSERMGNPCGGSPPEVTCLVSAGWITGVKLDPVATMPVPPGPPTAAPTATATAMPFFAPPFAATLAIEPTPTAVPSRVRPLLLPAVQVGR
jgi:hypothetical protein